MRAMTAYSTVVKKQGNKIVQVVLRSLNFKYLDIFIHNLPNEDIFVEDKIKKEINKKLSRGRIEVYLFFSQKIKVPEINEEIIKQYIQKIKVLSKKYKIKNDLDMSDIINLPGVFSSGTEKADEKMIMAALKEATDKLIVFKENEGKAIAVEIKKNIKEINESVLRIKHVMPKNFPENDKEDIAEEISLLIFYGDKMLKVITDKQETTKGKKIDFLTQEILRELNAASSKTRNSKIAELIVESKSCIERIREQAQNIE